MKKLPNLSIIHASTPVIRAQGFTLIELMIVVSVVAVLATTALDKLFWYQGQAEKANMEYTATMIKSGLWMRAASLMMADHAADIPALAEQNPIDLLAQKPENYLGAINNGNADALDSGNWFYDVPTRQVVYIVGHRRDFRPEVAEDFTVRYGMKVLYGEIESTPGHKAPYIAGIALVPLSKYTWH